MGNTWEHVIVRSEAFCSELLVAQWMRHVAHTVPPKGHGTRTKGAEAEQRLSGEPFEVKYWWRGPPK